METFYSDLRKEIFSAFWVLSLVISFILNFNFIGALIFRDWQWILDNWLCNIGIIILPLYYLFIHCVLVFGYKTAIKVFK